MINSCALIYLLTCLFIYLPLLLSSMEAPVVRHYFSFPSSSRSHPIHFPHRDRDFCIVWPYIQSISIPLGLLCEAGCGWEWGGVEVGVKYRFRSPCRASSVATHSTGRRVSVVRLVLLLLSSCAVLNFYALVSRSFELRTRFLYCV